jgi:hypothetical protein
MHLDSLSPVRPAKIQAGLSSSKEIPKTGFEKDCLGVVEEIFKPP